MARTTVGADGSVPMSTSANRGPSLIGADGTSAIALALLLLYVLTLLLAVLCGSETQN